MRCREAAGPISHLDDSQRVLPGTSGSFPVKSCFIAASPVEAARPGAGHSKGELRRDGQARQWLCSNARPVISSIIIGAAQAALPSRCCGGLRMALCRASVGGNYVRPDPGTHPSEPFRRARAALKAVRRNLRMPTSRPPRQCSPIPAFGVTQIARRLAGDTLSIHIRRTNREYPERCRLPVEPSRPPRCLRRCRQRRAIFAPGCRFEASTRGKP